MRDIRVVATFVAFGLALLVFGVPRVVKAGGCEIVFTMTNHQKYPISMRWQDSEVKSLVTVPAIPPFTRTRKVWGPWRKMGDRAHNIAAKSSADYTYKARFGCSQERQYRIRWTEKYAQGYQYLYPSTIRHIELTASE